MSTISFGIMNKLYTYQTPGILSATKADGIICVGLNTFGSSIHLEPGAKTYSME